MVQTVAVLALMIAAPAESQVPPLQPTATATPAVSPLTREQRVFGLVQFYSAARQHFAWFDRLPDLDWDQTFLEFLPLVEKRQGVLQYYQTLQRFAALLQDGHTSVYLPPPLRARFDSLPFRLDFVQGQYVVQERYPTDELLAEDLPAGSVLLRIKHCPPQDYFDRFVFPFLSAGTLQAKRDGVNWFMQFPAGAAIPCEFQYPDGSVHTRALTANRSSARWDPQRRREYLAPWRRGPDFASENLPGNLLYVRYGKCDDATQQAFCQLIESLSPPLPRALILDLRGNPGGSTPGAAISHLIARPLPYYRWRTRWSASYFEAQTAGSTDEHKAAYLKSHQMPDRFSPGWLSFDHTLAPSEHHYDGPLIILIDAGTGSAAEDLPVTLQGGRPLTIIGEPSSGSTGQPLMLDLPGGGKARICSGQARYADGREFIGVGIKPDIHVHRTIKAIADGRDEVLAAAETFIQEAASSQPTAEPQTAPTSQSAANPTEVIVIGTIHGLHHQADCYSPEVLKAIILALKPSAILNELPLDLVEPDGRPKVRDYVTAETWASDQAAAQLHIPQVPFDLPDRTDFFKRTRHFERQNRLSDWARQCFQTLRTQDPSNPDLACARFISEPDHIQQLLNNRPLPELINSDALDRLMYLKHVEAPPLFLAIFQNSPDFTPELAADFQHVQDVWLQRNAIMAQNIAKTARQYPAGRLVVLTGYEHRYALRELLRQEPGVALTEYWEVVDLDLRHVPPSSDREVWRKGQQRLLTESADVCRRYWQAVLESRWADASRLYPARSADHIRKESLRTRPAAILRIEDTREARLDEGTTHPITACVIKYQSGKILELKFGTRFTDGQCVIATTLAVVRDLTDPPPAASAPATPSPDQAPSTPPHSASSP